MYAMRLRDVAPDHDLLLSTIFSVTKTGLMRRKKMLNSSAGEKNPEHPARRPTPAIVGKDVVGALGIVELGRRRIDDGIIRRAPSPK